MANFPPEWVANFSAESVANLTPESTATMVRNTQVPRAYPYCIYDLGRNAGFVNVGVDHDTGAFAVASPDPRVVASRRAATVS